MIFKFNFVSCLFLYQELICGQGCMDPFNIHFLTQFGLCTDSPFLGEPRHDNYHNTNALFVIHYKPINIFSSVHHDHHLYLNRLITCAAIGLF